MLDAYEIGPDFVEIAGEFVLRMKVEIETADEDFIGGTDATGDGAESRRHLCGVFGSEVVVNENDEREREGFLGEDIDGLLDVVVENVEFGLAKVGDEIALLVLDGDGEDDEVGVYGDFVLGVG